MEKFEKQINLTYIWRKYNDSGLIASERFVGYTKCINNCELKSRHRSGMRLLGSERYQQVQIKYSMNEIGLVVV